MYDRLHEAEDNVGAVQHVDVGGRLAQPHTRDGPRLDDGLVGGAVLLQRLLDGVDEGLLLQMSRATWRS